AVIKQQLLSELQTFRREFDRQAIPQDELIHTTRVTIKRLRAVLALVKKEIGGARYRSDTLVAKALAKHLAGSRDASVAVETLTGLLRQQEAPTLPLRQLLGLMEAAAQKSVAALERVQIAWMLNELLQSLQEWHLERFGNGVFQDSCRMS
ncbi:MAG: CHAD domain-containing protein, partial [Shewanella algae]